MFRYPQSENPFQRTGFPMIFLPSSWGYPHDELENLHIDIVDTGSKRCNQCISYLQICSKWGECSRFFSRNRGFLPQWKTKQMKTLKRFKEPAGNPRKLKKKLKKTLENYGVFQVAICFPKDEFIQGGPVPFPFNSTQGSSSYQRTN